MKLDMTNENYVEGWFIGAIRTIKEHLEVADKIKSEDPKVAADRLADALYIARDGLAKYDAVQAELHKDNELKIEAARARRLEAEARLAQRRTPLPTVTPDGNGSLVGRDGARIRMPIFLQKDMQQ